MYINPFAGKTSQQILSMLNRSDKYDGDLPHWPSPDIQKGFIARVDVGAINVAQSYLGLMNDDGAFDGNWFGLDYGCGFGRFASLMLQYGPASRLNVCDPMPRVQNLIAEGNFKNKFYLLPQVVDENTDMGSGYSFIFASSVFTHFNISPFIDNIKQLYARLAVGGKLYITVSDKDFLPHFSKFWFKENGETKQKEFEKELKKDGFLFVPIIDAEPRRSFWGRSFVTEDFMEELPLAGKQVRFLGAPDSSQRLYSITKTA